MVIIEAVASVLGEEKLSLIFYDIVTEKFIEI